MWSAEQSTKRSYAQPRQALETNGGEEIDSLSSFERFVFDVQLIDVWAGLNEMVHDP